MSGCGCNPVAGNPTPDGGDVPLCDAVPTPMLAGQLGIAGAAVDASRCDHQHAVPVAAPVTVDKSANAAGVSLFLSRADHKHDVSTAVAVSISGNANAEGVATTIARSDHTHMLTVDAPANGEVPTWNGAAWEAMAPAAGAITNTQVTATLAASTVAVGYAVIPGMTFALAAGTWLVMFSTEQRQNVAGGGSFMAIFSAAAIVAHTEREQLQLAQAGEWHPGHTQAVLVLGALTTVDARFHTSVLGTAMEVRRRSLIAIKLA